MGRHGTYVSGMETPYGNPKELGIAVKRARANAGLTQDQLAKATGTTRKRIGAIEQGDLKTLGKTPQKWFAAVAPIAAATGDLSLIGLDDLGDRAELVSLRRDVDQLDRQFRQLADILAAAELGADEEIDRLLDSLGTNEPPQGEERGEGEGQRLG